MSIVSVDNIQPIGSGTSVTVNSAATLVLNNANSTGVITATSFVGSGANLTSLPAQATIANNADNRIITGGSGVNLNGEANLSFNGTNVKIGSGTPAFGVGSGLEIDTGGAATLRLEDSGSSSSFEIQNTGGVIKQNMYNSQPWTIVYNNSEKLRIDSYGALLVGTNAPLYTGGDMRHEIKKNNSRTYTAPLMSSHPHLLINNSDTTTNAFCGLGFRAGTGDGSIGYVYTGSTNAADFVINTDGGANGVERLRILSTGQVGINQSNPARALTINALGTGTSSRIVRLATQDNNTRFDFSFENANNLTIQNGSSDAAIVKLHTSGYVTKPSQPAFHARLVNNKSATTNPIIFDDVRVNTGSHYNSTGTDAGKFVAPIAGVYFFYIVSVKSNNGSVCRLYPMVDGSNIYNNMHLRLQETGTYSNGSLQFIYSLSAGSKVHISLQNGSILGAEYSHFGGHLIG